MHMQKLKNLFKGATMIGLMLLVGLLVASFGQARAQNNGTVDIVYTAGVNDNFVLPFEPTSPSDDLLLKMDPYGGGNRVLFPHRQFDDKAINRVFGHTFTNLPENIQAATFEIRMFAGGSSLVSNDAIHLELTGINDVFTSWNMGLTTLFGQPWIGGSDQTFSLDLANLLPDGQGDTNIIPFMNADNALDVYVQDDTAVDYIILTVTVPRKEKVTICHIPPGNPSNAHTITVGASAVNAHLNHGDTLGECEEEVPQCVKVNPRNLFQGACTDISWIEETNLPQCCGFEGPQGGINCGADQEWVVGVAASPTCYIPGS